MTGLLTRLLPAHADNQYLGQRAALWLLGLYIALKLIMSVNSILNTAMIASGDGLPLDRFGPEAARTVLMLFAITALGQLALAAVALLALIRYRALVPLVLLLLLAEQLGRRWIIASYAIERTETAAAIPVLVYGLMAMLALGLILSLIPRRARA